MLQYFPDSDNKAAVFTLSYQELKQVYDELVGLSDSEFKNRLPEAIHLACVICFFKEVPTDVCLSDYGIVHLLAHAIHFPEDEGVMSDWRTMRKKFEETLKLS